MGGVYTPNRTVLANLRQVTLAAVIGPTSVGKTTLMNQAVAESPDMQLVLTTTARLPRPGETDGVDYHFRSRQEMAARLARGGYVQVASVDGAPYATAPEDYVAAATTTIATMAVVADAMPVFKALPFKQIREIFVLPPSYEIWQIWLRQRHFSPAQLQSRLQEAQVSLQYALDTPDIAIMINDAHDMSGSARRLAALAHGEAPDGAAVARGRELAEKLLRQTRQGAHTAG